MPCRKEMLSAFTMSSILKLISLVNPGEIKRCGKKDIDILDFNMQKMNYLINLCLNYNPLRLCR